MAMWCVYKIGMRWSTALPVLPSLCSSSPCPQQGSRNKCQLVQDQHVYMKGHGVAQVSS